LKALKGSQYSWKSEDSTRAVAVGWKVQMGTNVWVGVDEKVKVMVEVPVAVGVEVAVKVWVGVQLRVGVEVGVRERVAVDVPVRVAVETKVEVEVPVGVGVAVSAAIVRVRVAVEVRVLVGLVGEEGPWFPAGHPAIARTMGARRKKIARMDRRTTPPRVEWGQFYQRIGPIAGTENDILGNR
jgi:hypothetical protein